jgi:glycosyltransferase involved in cell wall biosynthesis
MSEPRILHVVPHTGGGGETYIGHLDAIEGYRFDRLALTERGRPHETPAGLLRLRRALPDYELLHLHGDSAALVSLPLLRRKPAVITLNGLHLARRSGGARGRLARTGLRRALEAVDTVIAVSESERDLARELAPAARVELIHNGVPQREQPSEDERRAIREGLGLDPGAVVALFAAELTERKQPLQFADAVRVAGAEHPELVGLVLGDGPLREPLEARSGDRVRLLGHRRDFLELVGAADVVVLPSLWEGLAYAALEAMALGRATVVSDGPGNPDAVGEAGLVFPAGDVAGLSAALSRLAADPGLRASLGEAAARRARERFTIEGMVRGTAQVYESALGRELGR